MIIPLTNNPPQTGEALLRRARARDAARSAAQSRATGGTPDDFEGLPQGGTSPLRRVQHPPMMGRGSGVVPSSPMGVALRKKKMSRRPQGGGQLQLLQTSGGGGGGEDDDEEMPDSIARSGQRSPKFRQSLQLDD
jgi:hypothetical protein